ncbi:uncharacterized protein LOC117109786 [Anneissia japonica]|uniref:uncharacterized protein LOC117109786 n=1 Tax=Anneissia japonica TaxID=1529436 RepID=UPI001425639C|nr:uncharacterized protein LOC117109786 [Anneissia japonica]
MADSKFRPLSFSMFLTQFGACFIGEKLRWLRFLLGDILQPADLSNDADIAITLLQKLVVKGKIKEEDVCLLREIAELIEIQDAKDLLSKYAQNDPYQFQLISRERSAIFKALRAFNKTGKVTDMKILAGHYKLVDHEFTNEWDLIFHLEMYVWPTKKEEYLEEFHALINPQAQHVLVDTLAGKGT